MPLPEAVKLDETLIARTVMTERVKVFADRAVASAVTSPLGTILLAWLQAPVTGWKRAAVWLCLITLAEVFIVGVGYRFRLARSRGEGALPWSRWMIFAVFLAGLGWGTTVWFFWTEGQYLYYLLNLLVLVGVVGIDVVIMSPFRMAMTLFTGGILLPPMLHLALVPNQFSVQIAAGLTVLFVLVLQHSRVAEKQLIDGLDHATRNQALVGELARRSIALEAIQAELNRAQAVGNVGSWVGDIAADTMRLSAEACRILGLPEGTTESLKSYLLRTHEQDRHAVNRAWREALKGAAFDHEHRILVGNAVRWVRQKAELEFAADGSALSAEGIVQDITERKQDEQALRQSEERYRSLIEWSPEPLAVHRGGKLIYVNPAAIRMFGATSAQELVGKPILDLIHPDFHQIVLARVKGLALGGGTTPMIEEKYLRLDGTVIDLEVQGTSIIYDGEPAVQVSMRDVTARKQVDGALARASRRNEVFLRNASDGVHILDADGTVLEVSDSFCQMLGYAREELLGANPSLWDARWSADELTQVVAAQLVTGVHSVFETRHRRRDGSIFDVEVTGHSLELDGKAVLFNSARDISERKRAETVLRTRLRLTELANAGTLEDLLQYALDAAEEVTGSQMGFFHLVDPEQGCLTLQAWSKNALARGSTAEGEGKRYLVGEAGAWADCIRARAPVVHNDCARLARREELPVGSGPVTRLLLVPIIRAGRVTELMGVGDKASDYAQADVDAVQVIAGMVQDLVERIRAEEALKASEERIRAILAASPDGMITHRNGRIEYVNPAMLRMLGLDDPGEMIGHHASEFAARPSSAAFIAAAGRFRSGAPTPPTEVQMVRKDGSLLDVEMLGASLRQGDTLRIAVIRDASARKRAEAALHESEHRLSTVFHANPIAISVARIADGRIVDVNDAALRLYGAARDEIVGRVVTELGIYADLAQRTELISLLTRHGQVERFNVDLRNRSGAVLRAELTGRVIELRGEQCLVSMMVDVTERQRLEQVHLQAQKLESLGTLAGGIAHDFNNILAAIRGNADLAAAELGPGHSATQSLEEIRKASARASDLVRRIMAFGRPKEAKRELVDLGAVVGEVLKLLRSTLPAGISLRPDLAESAPRVLADAGQIHEAIVNLTTNAAYAIGPRAGSVEYRLEPVQVGEKLAQSIPGIKEGCYVRLKVKDSGCGMDEAMMARIFDAFYTTKPVGEGTGLGLSMVHGTMRSHGGAVTVESTPGKGSSFALYFPVAGEKPVKEDESPIVQLPLSAGRRVLYVDDEEALVFLANRVLTRLGHRVSSFTDPVEALAAFRARPQDYDVVVTDLSMPYMSGFEFARAVLGVRPEMPVLMMTGYARTDDERNARIIGIREVILKPATMDDLGRVLDQMFRDGELGEKSPV